VRIFDIEGFQSYLIALNRYQILGDQWLDFGYIEFSLLRPVFPDEKLTIRISKLPQQQIRVTMSKDSGKLCLDGTFLHSLQFNSNIAVAGLGKASWLDELTLSPLNRTVPDPPQTKPRLTPENAPTSTPFSHSLSYTISPSKSKSYINRFTRDSENPIWQQKSAIHPGNVQLENFFQLERLDRRTNDLVIRRKLLTLTCNSHTKQNSTFKEIVERNFY
jgi:hypothetical protein